MRPDDRRDSASPFDEGAFGQGKLGLISQRRPRFLTRHLHTLAFASKGRVGDLAIKHAAGSKYMAGGVLNWAPAIPQ
jgi:hypothetical protein